MAHPSVSKMVTDRQRRCEYVKWFVKTYRQEVTEALDLFLDPGEAVSGSETVPGSGPSSSASSVLAAHLDRLLGRLDRALEELIEAEQAHLDEVADDAVPRKQRDAAAQALREVLFDLRRLYRGAYGREQAEELGFERRVAPDPLALLRQALRIRENVSPPRSPRGDDLAGEMPAPRYAGITVPGSAARAALDPPVAELRAALDEVNRQRGRCQGTKLVKDKAIAVFDETYLQIARMLVSSFRLAGKEKLAGQIPLSLRRRTRSKDSHGKVAGA